MSHKLHRDPIRLPGPRIKSFRFRASLQERHRPASTSAAISEPSERLWWRRIVRKSRRDATPNVAAALLCRPNLTPDLERPASESRRSGSIAPERTQKRRPLLIGTAF